MNLWYELVLDIVGVIFFQENDYFAVDMDVCLSSDIVHFMQLHG